ncbi:MAG TPA: PBP1A family penicillin-binding protein [Myxococcaceae bacterium]|nr:PBP1A family penicillin-binding protein [Myxococcaceae bacterium]
MPRRTPRSSLLRRLLLVLGALVLALVGTVVGVFLWFNRGLPSVEALRDYRPPQVTKVTCADGKVCAEYFFERRTLVDAATLPAHVRDAFLAAEDADFYRHEGLDYLGMVRAGIKALLPGGHLTGASTITQQACRNLLLSQERKLSRKIREWILTPRMERALSKDQILNLYLNQIYFGHNRYGVEEAALYYFGKHASALSVAEAAMLAGVVQQPERINPVTSMTRATARQTYVLGQMLKHGMLPARDHDAALKTSVVLGPRPPPPVGPYYVEEIRRMLVARYGDTAVLTSGMRVEIAMDPKRQALADAALREGLEALDRRMGYRGALGELDTKRFAQLRTLLEKRLADTGRRTQEGALLADLSRLAQPKQPAGEDEGAEERPETSAEGEAAPTSDEVLVRAVPLVPLKEGLRLGGYVTQVDDARKMATLDFVGRQGTLAFATVAWARPRGVGKWTQAPVKLSDVLKPGQLVRARVLSMPAAGKPLDVTLDQVPEVQGALTVIDPATRRVLALSGGYDFARSSFNRATQAHRQPGSAFKPFLYAAALQSQKFTPVSVLNDAPEAVRDPWTGKVWKPHNYERSGFEGPMTLRQALTKSKNTVSVRLIEAITPQVAIDFARRAGIRSEMPDNLTLALGTGEVTVLELANAYTTFDTLGKYSDPVLLVRVTDVRGATLEEHQAAPEETIPPPVAYVATSLMRSVVEEGTAAAVRELGRPAAGKTGTANEYRDAWFSGYTPDLVATAWVGFDDHSSLGTGETGGRAALPIWLGFMRAALDGKAARDFDLPPGVQTVRVDPSSGLLAGAHVPGRAENFLEGTAPTAEAPPPGQASPDRFLMEEPGRDRL